MERQTKCGRWLDDNVACCCGACSAREEALWTEYAKAALTSYRAKNTVIDAEAIAQLVAADADAMLTAHKKRWGHE